MSFLWRSLARTVSRAPAGSGAASQPVLAPLTRRALLGGSVALVGTLALVPLLGPVAHAADAPGADGARQFIGELANKAIAVMASKSESDTNRDQMFEALFVSSFDLAAIGERVLGRYWHNATPDQRDTFLKLFQQQEVLVWSSRFKSYNGQKLVVESAEQAQGGGWEVRSHIDQPSGGSSIPLVWTVAQVGSNWRISDIGVSGVSMALTLHQDFSSVLASNGGKIDGLLAAMQKKIDQLKAG